MSRSKWKGPIFKGRSTTIIPGLVGLSFPLHDGKNIKSIIISSLSVGLKMGELLYTKKIPVFKKKS